MKSTQNYSINVKVLEAFNEEVDTGHRSEIIEALIVEFLVRYTRELKLPNVVNNSNGLTQEII
jgi:hypothetical protein